MRACLPDLNDGGTRFAYLSMFPATIDHDKVEVCNGEEQSEEERHGVEVEMPLHSA